ncbi:MAG: phenylalanine--tRNA ligase subunit beta, partial [Myxococcota bacterium]
GTPTLDGVARKLVPEDLVICDAARPVALAGVMGGEATEVGAGTTDILLESAYFAPAGIRRTAKRHGLKTEASHRFERGCDPEMVVPALGRAAALLAELAGGHVASGVLDVYPAPLARPAIRLDPARANALLGVSLSAGDMANILGRLGMQVREKKGALETQAPSWRPDLAIEVDLIEEVARLHGYDRIPTTLPRAPIQRREPQPARRLEAIAREVLTGFGLHEAITYRFVSADWPDRLKLVGDDPRRRFVRLRNPLREDQAVMRTSIVPGLLLAAEGNVRRDHANVRLFEAGKVFLERSPNALPEERIMISAIICGEGRPGYWGKGTPADFYDAKGVVEALLERLSVRGARFMPEGVSPYFHPGMAASVQWEKGSLGELGCIHPDVAAAQELPENTFLVDLCADELLRASGARPGGFRPLPRFPAVRRDIAVVVQEGIAAGELVDRIRSIPDAAFQAALREIRIFDVYLGKGIPAGKKSVALRLSYRSDERTLTDTEVSAFQDRVLSRLADELGAELRT